MSHLYQHAILIPIGIDDLFDVFSVLLPIAFRWERMGHAFKLRPHVIDTIKTNRIDVEGRLIDVLSKWLKKADNILSEDPSWEVLVEAVTNPAGGDNPALAEQIKNMAKLNVTK